MKKTTAQKHHVYYAGIAEPIDVRRAILESSKQTIKSSADLLLKLFLIKDKFFLSLNMPKISPEVIKLNKYELK